MGNIETPALVLSQEVMERNIGKMAQIACQRGVKLRPHIKTHKSGAIANKQIIEGSCGITVSKISEGQVMAQNGIKDILLAYPIVGDEKIQGLLKLADHVRLITMVDSLALAQPLAQAADQANLRLDTYLKIDTGMGRTGVLPGQRALELALELSKLPGLNLMGIMSHPGQAYTASGPEQMVQIAQQEGDLMVQTAQLLRDHGLSIKEVSVGSTPTCWTGVIPEGVTEIRPGTYVFNDANNVLWNMAREEDCAATVLVTVISRPHSRRIIIDGGSKSVGKETNPLRKGFGLIKGMPDAYLERVYEEHGVIETLEDTNLPIGSKLEIIPTHICPVVNLYDNYVLTKNNQVVGLWAVDARGCNK